MANGMIGWAVYLFPLVVGLLGGMNVFILHDFRYITTLSVYVTVCDLEQSFIFDTTVEITGDVRFPVHV